MRMTLTLKTILVGALVSLTGVALSGAANAANLGACGSAGANLLSNFVNANGVDLGNTCTVGDKTFSNFKYTPFGAFMPGGANPVPPSAVSVGAVNPDPTAPQSGNCPNMNICPGLVFTANWAAGAVNSDVDIQFIVTGPANSIIDSEAALSGATAGVNDVAMYVNNATGAQLGTRTVTAGNPSQITFPGAPTTGLTSVFVDNDMTVPAGESAMDIEKLFSQMSTTTDHHDGNSDSEEPGSVIVLPKFIQGTAALSEGGVAPISELEIGVVCPKGVTCSEHQPVKIRFHWVCGSSEGDTAGSFVCKETDFDINATVFEKIVLTPNGETAGLYTAGLPSKFAPPPNCPNGGGYLIGWVINPANDQPVKFDGLIGDAHLRPGSPAAPAPNPFAGSGLALGDYKAIPIQADPGLDTFPATNSVITTNGNGALMFDGLPGHYTQVTGQVMGDVRYTNLTTGPTFSLGVLTLLTLDVKSNRPNNPVFVDLDFFGGNPSAIGNENQLSTSTEFICWEEIPITAINAGLTTAQMGRKGVFVSAPAVKVGLNGIMDETGPTTLLGLSEVLEGGVFPALGAPWPRASFTSLFNSSVGVPTHFLPTPSPNFLP